MKPLRLNHKPNGKSQGFTPRNPPKTVYAASRRPQEEVSKYELAPTVENDASRCTELEAVIEVYEIMRAIPEQIKSGQDLQVLLQERDSYLDLVRFAEASEVKTVSLTERPQGKNLWEGLSEALKKEIAAVRSLAAAEKLQEKYLAENGLFSKVTDYQKPLSYEERRVKRAEFNGGINKPTKRKLSPGYREWCENGTPTGAYSPDAYQLEAYPAWQKLALYPNFAAKKTEFARALAHQSVAPELAAEMNVFDFEHAMFTYHEDCYGDTGINSLSLFEGSREFTVLTFAKNHGAEFVQSLEKFKPLPGEAEKAQGFLKKGRLPVVKLEGGKVLKGTVHHLHAIYDAAVMENKGKGEVLAGRSDVNDTSNHVIIYEVCEGRPGAANFAERPKMPRKSWDELTEENEINLPAADVDWLKLANDREAKADYLKELTRQQGTKLLDAMQNLGIPNQEIVRVVRSMMETGKMPAAELADGSLAGLNLVREGEEAVLRFGKIERDSAEADIHQGIFHGNSLRPVYESSGKGQQLVQAESGHDGERFVHDKEAYAIESDSRRKVIKRIMAKSRMQRLENGESFEAHPFCYMGSLSNVIYFSPQDKEDAAHRYDHKYRQENYPRKPSFSKPQTFETKERR